MYDCVLQTFNGETREIGNYGSIVIDSNVFKDVPLFMVLCSENFINDEKGKSHCDKTYKYGYYERFAEKRIRYYLGLNISSNPFSIYDNLEDIRGHGIPIHHLDHDGLKFDIFDDGELLALVEIPKDECVAIDYYSFCVNSVIIKKIIPLRKNRTWKFLFNLGFYIYRDKPKPPVMLSSGINRIYYREWYSYIPINVIKYRIWFLYFKVDFRIYDNDTLKKCMIVAIKNFDLIAFVILLYGWLFQYGPIHFD